jgi:hypothetical protein
MKFLFIFFLLPLQLFAQDISGVWVGTLYNDTTKQYIPYELAINEYNGKLSGYSHTIFIIDSIKNIGVKTVKIRKKKDEFFVEDEKLIYNNYNEPPAKGVKTFSKLTFSENDSTGVLSGSWNTNPTREYSPLTGTIFLQRKKKIRETLIVKKLDQMGLSDKLSFLPAPNPPNELANAESQEKTSIAINKKNPEQKNNVAEVEKDQTNPKSVMAKEEIKTNPAIAQPQKEIEKIKSLEKPSVVINEKPEKEKTIALAPEKNINNPKVETIKEETINKLAIAQPQKEIEKVKSPEKPSVVINEKPEKEKTIALVTEKNLNKPKVETIKEETINKPAIAQPHKEIEKIKSPEKPSVAINVKPEKEKTIALVTEKNINNPKVETIKEETINKPAIAQPQKEIEKIKSPEKPSVVINEKAVTEKNKVAIIEKNPTQPKAEIVKKEQPKNDTVVLNKEKNKTLPGIETKKEMPGLFSQQNEISKNEIQVVPAAADIATRKIETIQTVEITQDSLVLSLFDNGVVDGDTVSVLINGKVIWPRVGLLVKATNKTIYLTPDMGDSIFVVMYAENLGSIPPNTGLLVIRDGGIDHEIRFSGDLKKNSAIILKRIKKD